MLVAGWAFPGQSCALSLQSNSAGRARANGLLRMSGGMYTAALCTRGSHSLTRNRRTHFARRNGNLFASPPQRPLYTCAVLNGAMLPKFSHDFIRDSVDYRHFNAQKNCAPKRSRSHM
jgi:hypothetical protein